MVELADHGDPSGIARGRVATECESEQGRFVYRLSRTSCVLRGAGLALAPAVLVIAGCGNLLASELSGIIAEAVTFVTAPDPDGQHLCQGPPARCGPPIVFALLVPDCPLDVVCFGDACNHHDRCYGTCGSSQTVCDNQFLEELLAACSDALSEGAAEFQHCAALAYIYWKVTVTIGPFAFDISQDLVCECLGITREKTSGAKHTDTKPLQFQPYIDSDGDLLPDAWEREHGLDSDDRLDADEDPDSDGMINLEEFMLMRHPFEEDLYSSDPAGE